MNFQNNYYQPGVNIGLTKQVQLAKMISEYNESIQHDIVERQFDVDGNVIRDFKKELDVYINDEITNVLPNIDNSVFNAWKKFKEKQKSEVNEISIQMPAKKYNNFDFPYMAKPAQKFDKSIIQGKPQKIRVKLTSENNPFKLNFKVWLFRPMLNFLF